VLRDVSARYRAEEELHQAIRARDDMMGIVSHDLRNPASAVKMLARSILANHARARDIPSDVRSAWRSCSRPRRRSTP
jgi:signal transduction histidine kinase